MNRPDTTPRHATELTRRAMIRGCAQAAALAGAVHTLAAEAAERPTTNALRELGLGIVIHSYGIRRSRHPESRFAEPLAFFEYCRALGAAGVQTNLGALEDNQIEAVRTAAQAGNMYLEGIVSLPRDSQDLPRFEREIETTAACGATVIRTVMLSGRRYETFDTADAFEAFRRERCRALSLAKPIVERAKVRLAVENHKDWRADELLAILNRINSPSIGICLDTGNSIALLEEPHAVVEAYAPFTFTTHFKDMAVREYAEGFLLSEVPLGTGLLDLARVVRTLRNAQPQVRLNLEMITRDPLRVPCLGQKYWATFERLPGRHLADTLRMVREEASEQSLPTVSDKGLSERLALEDNNVRQSLDYASKHLAAVASQ